ncbi:TIGR02444 family protein [Aestuariicella hydrocarbonica]|uniref:TIGR02444 family protein n=2 Tax=Pseudomaricurvus hydrocarbonicus TaxID=1470433 RepID=A0A9E5T339_9GAMM|nr:TIGR02444 family protein [Aestuariicella hydrocarbonica]
MSVFGQPLWDFSLSLYACEGMEPLCLLLQDERQANVNAFLWALWLDENRIPVDRELWHTGMKRIESWHQWRVKPLRQLRRALPKRQPWLALRSRVKQWELAAEKKELHELQALSQGWDNLGGSPPACGQFCYRLLLLPETDPLQAELERVLTRWRGVENTSKAR